MNRLVACLLLLIVHPQVITAEDQAVSLDLLVETLDEADDPVIRSALMRGMLSGLEGRRRVTAPEGWGNLSETLSRSEDPRVRELSFRLSQIFGDSKATSRALAMLKDPAVDSDVRRRVLQSMLQQQNQEVSLLLESLLDESALCLDAIRGYAMIENSAAPAILLNRYRKMNSEHRRTVIETLATRTRYAEALLAAIDDGRVDRDDIPSHVARSLNEILGDRFVAVFGEIREIAQDRERLIEKYKRMITPSAIASASASRGRGVFNKTCAACHRLYGEGGKIGPDLTGSNRANLDYILINSVDPSYDVPEGYKMVSILTVDGRVVNGVVAEEDEVRVVLKTVEQPRLVIAKEDIETRMVSAKSMMPDGQFEQMKPRQLFDLIKYLRTTEQVEMAE